MSSSQQKKMLLPLLLAAIAFFALHWNISCSSEFQSSVYSHSFDVSGHNDASLSSLSTINTAIGDKWNSNSNSDEAKYIIEKAYKSTYAHIIPCQTKDFFNPEPCIKQTRDQFNTDTNSTNSTIPLIPWWFQTLLRDLPTNGAFGQWHHFSTAHPPLHFCSIEKVGTTEWRNVFCQLNAEECRDPLLGKQCRDDCIKQTQREMPGDAPRAVFVRDPLERLLSAYLNKCYDDHFRRVGRHCEPNVVFNPDPDLVDEKGREVVPLTEGLEETKKQHFGAYVDVMPLKWNLHFVPQAIICGLYRNIDEYDFVGNMGTDFMRDLDRMANQFGGQLPSVLNATFDYEKFVKEQQHINTGAGYGHSTRAPEKVKQFYTARTIRRALEYLSIDYVTLGLDVPEWAVQMLKDDS